MVDLGILLCMAAVLIAAIIFLTILARDIKIPKEVCMVSQADRVDLVVIPKGTILKYRGIPCELVEDTPVFSTTIASIGLDGIDATGEQDCLVQDVL